MVGIAVLKALPIKVTVLTISMYSQQQTVICEDCTSNKYTFRINQISWKPSTPPINQKTYLSETLTPTLSWGRSEWDMVAVLGGGSVGLKLSYVHRTCFGSLSFIFWAGTQEKWIGLKWVERWSKDFWWIKMFSFRMFWMNNIKIKLGRRRKFTHTSKKKLIWNRTWLVNGIPKDT